MKYGTMFILAMIMLMPLATAAEISNVATSQTVASQVRLQTSFELKLHDTYTIPGTNFRVGLNNIAYQGNDPNPTFDMTICTTYGNSGTCAIYSQVELYKTITSSDKSVSLKITPTAWLSNGVLEVSYYIDNIGNNNAPVIDGVSGPQNLNVGENGVWQISAHDDGQNLRYKVDWGDRPIIYLTMGSSKAMAESVVLQDSTFSHTYTNPGRYTVRFTVVDEKGMTAESTITVNVDANNNAHPDLVVSDVEFNEPVYAGQSVDFTIRLKNYGNADATYYSMEYNYGDGSGSGMASSSYQTIKPGDVLTLTTTHTYSSTGAYTFMVSVKTDNDLNPDNNVAYKTVNVQPNIVPVNGAPVIDGTSGPQNLNINEQGTWSISAHDDGKNLRYVVDWGDTPKYDGLYQGAASNVMTMQDSTFTHSYSNSGRYTVRFTVIDENGQSAQTSITVNVGSQNVITPTPVPMPTYPSILTDKNSRLKDLYNQLLEIIKQIIELQNSTN